MHDTGSSLSNWNALSKVYKNQDITRASVPDRCQTMGLPEEVPSVEQVMLPHIQKIHGGPIFLILVRLVMMIHAIVGCTNISLPWRLGMLEDSRESFVAAMEDEWSHVSTDFEKSIFLKRQTKFFVDGIAWQGRYGLGFSKARILNFLAGRTLFRSTKRPHAGPALDALQIALQNQPLNLAHVRHAIPDFFRNHDAVRKQTFFRNRLIQEDNLDAFLCLKEVDTFAFLLKAIELKSYRILQWLLEKETRTTFEQIECLSKAMSTNDPIAVRMLMPFIDWSQLDENFLDLEPQIAAYCNEAIFELFKQPPARNRLMQEAVPTIARIGNSELWHCYKNQVPNDQLPALIDFDNFAVFKDVLPGSSNQNRVNALMRFIYEAPALEGYLQLAQLLVGVTLSQDDRNELMALVNRDDDGNQMIHERGRETVLEFVQKYFS